MEELQIGEWVRTKDGQIDKIYDYKKDTKIYICEKDLIIDSQNLLATHIKDILKHSKNIIDLIEKGDYVNDYKILNIANVNNSDKKVFTIHKSNFKDICKIWGNEDIKKILTHEKYEKECYRIGE